MCEADAIERPHLRRRWRVVVSIQDQFYSISVQASYGDLYYGMLTATPFEVGPARCFEVGKIEHLTLHCLLGGRLQAPFEIAGQGDAQAADDPPVLCSMFASPSMVLHMPLLFCPVHTVIAVFPSSRLLRWLLALFEVPLQRSLCIFLRLEEGRNQGEGRR